MGPKMNEDTSVWDNTFSYRQKIVDVRVIFDQACVFNGIQEGLLNVVQIPLSLVRGEGVDLDGKPTRQHRKTSCLLGYPGPILPPIFGDQDAPLERAVVAIDTRRPRQGEFQFFR